ncbi:BAG family molecular chaperone regulator 3 [Aegilops tauschii subsp. strangulata]|uniref:Ubiquitin-like domain-containing protein n=2 Tax=Aegilops tauschii subsp. strangulata TaxID=200361 RepID=A0A453LDA1_AEGTS|nr:BAG family molecular chaperone regulator 1 [Aegilops tauschii subsp. strangulata]
MMRAKGKATFLDAMKETTSPVSPAAAKEALKEDEWEVRPGGMLVQKRDPDSDAPAGAPVPTVRLKVKFNGVSHEIYINSQASFGELKKMMSEKTGLHHEDQKVLYKGKEMDSKAFLDMSGVKDRSKLVLLEDPDAQAKRLIEQRRADKAHRASKSVSRISLDVDKLATKVSALEAIVRKGGKVVEADVVALTEALMTELVKLDAIAADGEVKAQRRLQEKRVQKYVETLDVIRAKNASAPTANGNGHAKNAAAPKANGHGNGPAKADRSLHLPPRPPPVSQRRQFKQQPAPATGKAAAAPPTASWETFDLLSSMPSTSSATATTTMAAATTTTKPANNSTTSPIPRFDWELF